jgi:V/A-type H+-transporting ATPase subunit I
MIAKMKKYSFLIFHKDYPDFLHALRELGVVHVIEKQCGAIDENSDLFGFIHNGKRFKTVIKALSKIKEVHKIDELRPENKTEDGMALLEKTEQLYTDREQTLQRKNVLIKELERIKPWGHFDLENLRKLEHAGFFIHFHATSESKFEKTWIDEYNAIKINQQGSTIYFVTITKESAHPDINTEHIKSFEDSATGLETALVAIDEEICQIDESLKMMVKNDLNTLIYKEKETSDQINWEKVALSSEAAAAEKLMLLEGFVPEEKEPETTAALQNEGVYFEVSTPTLEEKPPILLKNNRFAKLFEVISNLYDRPNYNAFDLTPFFAPFYVIFFGLCVGDCGYGLIYILLSFYFAKSKDAFMKSVSKLVLWLGIGTVIFGFISGTFFGIPLSEQSWEWLQRFKTVMVNKEQLFNVALICGGVQLVFAMIIKVITTWMRFSFWHSLNMMGWLITILGTGLGILLADRGVMSLEMRPVFLYIVCGTGLFMMLFFNNPEKGLKGIPGSIGSGLFGLYSKISGLMGDMLSYIRLFALGISGAVMGLVFNQLAFSFAPDVIILKQFVIMLILVIGHALNIFLCSLSGFVHPMRLTFVEFYNNAGFEGNGKPYLPFKKTTLD